MPEDQTSELDATELIGLVEGTVAELKEYVRENDFSDAQLEQILSAESTSNDRKTAKKFLRREMDSKQDTSGSEENSDEKGSNDQTEEIEVQKTSLSREALLQMLGGTVKDVKKYVKENDPSDDELQSLLHAEKMVKDRKTVVSFLKSYSKKKELEEDFHRAETDLKELKEDLENIEENVLEDDVKLELANIPDAETTDEEPEEDSEEKDEETQDKPDTEEEQTDEEEDSEDTETESDAEEKEETSEEEEEESEKDEENTDGSEEQEDELTEMEKKKQVLEDIEMDLPEEELKQITLEELNQLRDEKKKREKLIDRLSTKFDRKQLEKVTTKDLEKLDDEVGDSGDISKQEAQKKEEEAKRQNKKDEEKMKKEAQEDLEMMMGAVKNSGSEEDDDSGPGAVEQLKQLPDKFKGVLSRGGDGDEQKSSGFDDAKTIEVLDDYSEAEDREATVKTAQVMKGYLEYALGIDREMTYAELAEEMELHEFESENIDTLIEFYRSMKISVYTGDVETDNIDDVIEASKATVKELG